MHFNVHSGMMGDTPERIIFAAGLATCGDPDLWHEATHMNGIERLDGRMADEPAAIHEAAHKPSSMRR